MKQWDSHLLHRLKVKNKKYAIILTQVGCGFRDVDKAAAGAAFAAPMILVDDTCRTNYHIFVFGLIFVLRPFYTYYFPGQAPWAVYQN